MTRRRWIADEVDGNTAALVGSHAAHLIRVLRAEIGQEFDIATGGAVRRGRIVSISNTNSNSKARVEFVLGEEQALKPAADVTLALAIFKFDRMEWAIEKCTEVGVARIIPIVARRTGAHLAAAAMKRLERWQRIALQATEQSRRGAPPEVATPVKLKDLGSAGAPLASQPQAATTNCRIVLAESEGNTRLRDVLRPQLAGVVLAIGPEGGWTAEELQWLHDSGWIAASLGDTIFRAETAAIVATALAVDSLR
jgi:16S rRNA (uracil1498-N3)-methyltransferase